LSIDSKSAITLAFLDTAINFLQKNLFWVISALFANFEAKREKLKIVVPECPSIILFNLISFEKEVP
jgi:hypothetical protein